MQISPNRHCIEGILDEACDWDSDNDDGDIIASEERGSVISSQSLSNHQFLDQICKAKPTLNHQHDSASHFFEDGVPIVEDGGILKKVIIQGMGAPVNDNNFVLYHYSGYTALAPEPFATSYLSKSPMRFRVGFGSHLPSLPCIGLEFALKSMVVGETSLFVMSPDYGYGKIGLGRVGLSVPENAWLMWKVEVVGLVSVSPCEDLLMKTTEERHNVPFIDIIEAVTKEKDAGTDLYHMHDYAGAKRHYKKAYDLLLRSVPQGESDESISLLLSQKLLRNLAQTSLKMRRNADCCRYADEALELDPKDAIVLYKKTEALINLGEFESATKFLSRCEKCSTGYDCDFKKKLMQQRGRLEKERNDQLMQRDKLERAMAKGIFGSRSRDLVQLSAEFRDVIKGDFDGLENGKHKQLTFELKDLSEEETAYIEAEAHKRSFTCNRVQAEIGRHILLIQ